MFFMGIIDSALVALFPDVVMIDLTLQHPHLLLWYVLVCTAGTTLGSIILLQVVKRLGGPWVESKIPPARFKRIHANFERYELMSVAVPACLPPPIPFKPFLLVAGLVEMSWSSFGISMFVGRGIRYLLEAWIALRYGPAALQVLKHHPMLVVIAGIVLLAGGYCYGRCRNPKPSPTLSEEEHMAKASE